MFLTNWVTDHKQELHSANINLTGDQPHRELSQNLFRATMHGSLSTSDGDGRCGGNAVVPIRFSNSFGHGETLISSKNSLS